LFLDKKCWSFACFIKRKYQTITFILDVTQIRVQNHPHHFWKLKTKFQTCEVIETAFGSCGGCSDGTYIWWVGGRKLDRCKTREKNTNQQNLKYSLVAKEKLETVVVETEFGNSSRFCQFRV
jgi:hypothetical protein